MSEGQIMCIVTNIYLLLSVQVMQVLACSHMMVEKPSLLKRLNMTSITTSFLTSDSTLRLYNSVFYTLIFPLITTLQGTPFSAFCMMFFSSTKQYIFGLKTTNSVIRGLLCLSLKMGPGSYLLKLKNDESKANLLLSISCSL